MLGKFEKAVKAHCELGRRESGEVGGSVAILLVGWCRASGSGGERYASRGIVSHWAGLVQCPPSAGVLVMWLPVMMSSHRGCTRSWHLSAATWGSPRRSDTAPHASMISEDLRADRESDGACERITWVDRDSLGLSVPIRV